MSWFYLILVPSHIVGEIALVPFSWGSSSDQFSPLFFSLPLIAAPTANTTDTIYNRLIRLTYTLPQYQNIYQSVKIG